MQEVLATPSGCFNVLALKKNTALPVQCQDRFMLGALLRFEFVLEKHSHFRTNFEGKMLPKWRSKSINNSKNALRKAASKWILFFDENCSSF